MFWGFAAYLLQPIGDGIRSHEIAIQNCGKFLHFLNQEVIRSNVLGYRRFDMDSHIYW